MSSTDSELVVESITSYLRDSVRSWSNASGLQSAVPEIVTRPWSFMLRYPLVKSDGETGALLVKVARHQDLDLAHSIKETALLERTEREFEMLSSIANVFQNRNGNSEYCFVRPLEVLPQWNAILMEELEARTLKTFILQPNMMFGLSRDWLNVELYLAKASRWLREYHHGMGDVQRLRLADAGVPTRIKSILAQLSAKIPEKRLKTIQSYLEAQTQKLADHPLEVAMLHNDFHCGNILVTPEGRVGALDADLVRGPIYQDLAKCYADLMTRSMQLITLGRFIPAARLGRCYRSIVQGYFGAEFDGDEVLKYFVFIAILEKWTIDEKISTQSSGTKSFMLRLLLGWRRSYFLKLLNETMK